MAQLEESYQGFFADTYKPFSATANIFDINLDEETFDKLSMEELKSRKVVPPPQALQADKSAGSAGLNFFDSLRAPPLPSKAIRGSTMESRFRLSSISETEELLKLRHD